MSRYALDAEDEFEPGSNNLVLRNKLGITDASEIAIEETRCFARTYNDSLDTIDSEDRITAATISGFHQAWLGEIYAFAGKFRAVNISKNNLLFCPAANIGPQMVDFERGMLANLTPCRSDTIEELSEKLAEVHAEIIIIHPFREGNGRTARWLADIMAIQAGFLPPRYDLEYRDDSPQRLEYFEANRKAITGNLTKLCDLFARWLTAASSGS